MKIENQHTYVLIKDMRQNGLSASFIQMLHDDYNWSYSDIARAVGKTRAAVSWHVRNYLDKTPREVGLDQHWPFGELTPEHTNQRTARSLRDHVNFYMTNGEDMSTVSLDRLSTLYQRLLEEDLVVEYLPDTHEGWAFVPRRAKDRSLIIRKNKYTRQLDAQDRECWSLPDAEHLEGLLGACFQELKQAYYLRSQR